jgi:hypothetical protein
VIRLVRVVLVPLSCLSLIACAFYGDDAAINTRVVSEVEFTISGEVYGETLDRTVTAQLDSTVVVDDVLIIQDLPEALFDPTAGHQPNSRSDLYVWIATTPQANGQILYEVRLSRVPEVGMTQVLHEPILVVELDTTARIHIGVEGEPVASGIDLSLRPLSVR